MNDQLLTIEMLYGFKCLRPNYSFGWSDPRAIYAVEQATGIRPAMLGSPCRPRCDYCGMFTHPEGYKCKSCGAPK